MMIYIRLYTYTGELNFNRILNMIKSEPIVSDIIKSMTDDNNLTIYKNNIHWICMKY